MKKKILAIVLAVLLVLPVMVTFTACRSKGGWQAPKRVSLTLPDKLHVEYVNYSIKGDSTLPGYCVLVKEGNLYYVKTPHKYYHYNRLEVFVKTNLKNAVEFAGQAYGQGHISASWSDGTNTWRTAAEETGNQWQANDQNGSVYYTGIGFLDVGYGDVNHLYENGVANSNGHKFTATQLANETLTIGTNQVECVVWEYEEYFSSTNWGKSKFWFDAETNITLKKTEIYPSSENQDLDAEENVGFKATYFSKNETLQNYLTSIERWPAPDFSAYK